MFVAIMKDSKNFRDSIEIISQLIDDGLFNIKKEGIELNAADRTMVSFVDFKLSASAFDKYEYDKDTTVGLNMLNLLTILKRADTNDKMTLTLNESDSILEVLFEGSSVRKFSIPLLQISKRDVPDIEQLLKKFTATAEVSSDVFEQGISDGDCRRLCNNRAFARQAQDVLGGQQQQERVKAFQGNGHAS